MDEIVKKFLEKKGIQYLLPIESLEHSNSLYGFVQEGVFHICDESLNEILLSEIFDKKNAILGMTDDKYYNVNEHKERCPGTKRFLLLDVTNGTIIYNNGFHFSKSDNNKFLIWGQDIYPKPLYENNYYGITTLGNKTEKWTRVIIDDNKCDVHYIAIIGDWKYILTSSPYILYDSTGKEICSFDNRTDETWVSLVTFKCGAFLLIFTSVSYQDIQNDWRKETKKTTWVYSSLHNKLHKVDIPIPNDNKSEQYLFDKDRVFLYFKYNHYDECFADFIILDKYGEIISHNKREVFKGICREDFSVFKNNIIISKMIDYQYEYYDYDEEREVGHYSKCQLIRDIDGTELGVCGEKDKYAKIHRETPNPYKINETKELFGLLRISDATIVIPTIYDSITVNEFNDTESNDSFSGYIAIIEIGIIKNKRYMGLIKNDRMVVPINNYTISEILSSRENRYGERERDRIGYYEIEKDDGDVGIFYKETNDCVWFNKYQEIQNSSCLLVWRGSKAAIMKNGIVISDFKYRDAIATGDGSHLNDDTFYVYGEGKKSMGFFNAKKGEIMPLAFYCIKQMGAIGFVADDCLYNTKGKKVFDPSFVGNYKEVVYLYKNVDDITIWIDSVIYDLGYNVIANLTNQSLSFINKKWNIIVCKAGSGDYVFYNYKGVLLMSGKDYYYKEKNGTYVFDEYLEYNPRKNAFIE